MDDARFKSAVQLASDTRKEVEAAMETSPEALAGGYRKAPAERRPVLLAQLIWCSREIRAAWDGVSLIAQQLLRDGEPLPGELASWMADVLARKRSRPTARGKDPDANFARNRAIVDAVQWLVQQGFRATRSKAMAVASVEGGSACDAGRRQS